MIRTAIPQRRPRRRRQLRLAVVGIGALSLVPWIAYLAVTLPGTYEAQNWSLAWVGFDVLLMIMLGATAVLGHLRHPMVTTTAFATGVLLCCDAWLDWTTSSGADHTWATVTALLVELPLAAFLIISSFRTSPARSSSGPRAVRSSPVRSRLLQQVRTDAGGADVLRAPA